MDAKRLRKTLWLMGNLSFKLHSGQLEIYNEIYKHMETGQKEFALRISRQYGKSYLTVILALEACIKYPNSIIRILGPTLDSVSKIVDDNLQPIIADAPAGLITRHRSDKRYNFPNGSSLRIGTLERAHIDATARGGNANMVLLEECAASVKSEDLKYAIQSVVNPQLLRSSKLKHGGILAYITTPADSPEHYFHTEIEPKLMSVGAYWCRTVYDNPQLTPEQIQLAMVRCGGEQSESWKREYLCQMFRSDSVVIIPEFSNINHVSGTITLPKARNMQTVIDFGGSRDATAALFGCYDYNNKKIIVWDEVFTRSQTPTVEIVRQIIEMEASDSFGPKTRHADLPGLISVDLNQTMGFICQQTLKDDASGSLQAVRNAFFNNEIIIHPRCKMLIKTLLAGRWNKGRTDYTRTDELGHCDALDALIYFVRNVDKTRPVELSLVSKSGDNMFDRRSTIPTGVARLGKMWS